MESEKQGFLERHEKKVPTIASIVQSIAIIVAGLWLGGVFYYSEILKPSFSEGFLNSTVGLSKVGVEKEVGGVTYVVMSLNLDLQNNSGQKLRIPSSFFVVNGEKYSTGPSSFTADDVQKNVDAFRGSRAKFKGDAKFSEVVYVGSEYSGWELAVGEKVTHSRLFRVPADRYDQLVADWYVTRRNADLSSINVSQVVTPDPTYQFKFDSCICVNVCPEIADIKKSVAHSGNCPSPWLDLESPEGDRLLGDTNKTGKTTVTSYFVMTQP
jgi:hypothetical protein